MERRLGKLLKSCLLVFLGLLVLGLLLAIYNTRDRTRGYRLNLTVAAHGAEPASQLQAGFARACITPELVDTWTDADGNARYQPDKGDTFQDVNGNGVFDAYWLAGFHNARPAQSVHDDLWATAMVIDDGVHRLAIVGIDAIGFFYDDVIDVRRRLPAEWRIDHAVVASTHCHEVPDLMGIWGESELKNGVHPDYRDLVKQRIVEAIGVAARGLRPAHLRAFEVPDVANGVRDTREPQVFDSGVRVLRFYAGADGPTLGTVVCWANHPETLWSDNLQITSDFCGYVRDGVTNGLVYDGKLLEPGLGGICLYLNGAIGGLMTPHRGLEVPDPCLDQTWSEPSQEKARAVGYTVAKAVLAAVRGESVLDDDHLAMAIRAKTIDLPVTNTLFRAAPMIHVIDRGTTGWFNLKSEVDLITLGDVWIATVPGEIYPEIVNGGIENPSGADFQVPPVEVPPLRALMGGKVNFVLGLANDEIGYIIPQSEWDAEPPWLYDSDHETYGEINSLGPETAPRLYHAICQLIAEAEARG